MHNSNLIQSLPVQYFSRLFLPSRLSSTILWLDSTDPNSDGTLPANNSLQSQWKDKSKSGIIFSQGTTGNKPQNKNAFVNGKNMLYFGNNATTYLDSTTTFTVGTTTSISFVMQTSVLTSARWLFETLGTAEFYIRQNSSVISGATWNGSGDIGLIGTAITSGQTCIITYTFSLTQSIIYLNGSQISSATYGSTSPNNNATHRIGSSSSLTANYQGYFGDIIIANTVWSTSDRRKIELFLGNKWGISV